MTDNDLLDAVDLLTRDRFIGTWVPDDAGELRVHTEKHPPLLRLLIDGTGISRGPKNSDKPLPIDADALEMLWQVRERLQLWCRALRVAFDGDELLSTMRRWYAHHANRVRSGQVSDEIDANITRTVQSWVTQIEGKFVPEEKREWKEPCVGNVTVTDESGNVEIRKCGARRVLIERRSRNGALVGHEEQFAIELNVTTLTATCRQCGAVWQGKDGLAELRFLTNVDNLIRAGGNVDQTAFDLLSTRGRK
jgi:hypothetical protein